MAKSKGRFAFLVAFLLAILGLIITGLGFAGAQQSSSPAPRTTFPIRNIPESDKPVAELERRLRTYRACLEAEPQNWEDFPCNQFSRPTTTPS